MSKITKPELDSSDMFEDRSVEKSLADFDSFFREYVYKDLMPEEQRWLLRLVRHLQKNRIDGYPTKRHPNMLMVALQLHMIACGSWDGADPKTAPIERADMVERDTAWMKKRLADWKPSPPQTVEWDEACKRLFEIALKEIEK